MDTRIINHNLKPQWEEYIGRNPYAIAWQSFAWLNVLKKHYKFVFFPLAAFHKSDICGILPLYQVDTFFEKNVLISVPYAVAGGIVADGEEASRSLLEKAVSLLKEKKSKKIILKHYKQKIDGDLATDANFYNRELTLSEDINAIWNNLAENNKENIETCGNKNLFLEYPSSDLNMFYRILLQQHHRLGIPCVSKKWVQSLIQSGMYSIALLKKENSIVAGTVVKIFKKTVSFPFTCLPADLIKNEIFAYSLYWKLIKYFAAQGFEIFHSGRIPQNDRTLAYRLGWGGTKFGYYYQYYPDPGSRTEYATKRGKKRELFESIWKGLPEFVAKGLGPHVVRHFP